MWAFSDILKLSEATMSTLVQKDSKNRVSIGTDVGDTHFLRDVDERGRIIFTPQVLIPKDEFEEKIITLTDPDRDKFVAALLTTPVRNEAFQKAKNEFNKKYK
jgi:hypothetical protein